MEISVIIPTYNREKFLIRAVKSVLDQSYPVYEILICDDGSTDGSKKLIKALNDKRIKWISGIHSGLPAIPRNKGLKISKGNWIAFLDSDDYWKPDKIKEQTAVSNRFNFISSNAIRVKNDKNTGSMVSYPKSTVKFINLIKANPVISSSVLVKKDLIVKAGLFSESKKFRAIEDYYLWLKISTFAKMCFINKNLVIYRDNPEESIRRFNTTENLQRRVVFKSLSKWLEKQNKFIYWIMLEVSKSKLEKNENIAHS